MRITRTIALMALMVTFLCSTADAQRGSKKKGSSMKGSSMKGSSKKGSSKKGSGMKGSGRKELLTKTYQVKFETSKGDFVIEVHPEWAPIGATHFKMLVDAKFYDDARFFRVIDKFMAQVGMNGDPKMHAKYSAIKIQDEAVKKSNQRGYVTYGQSSARNSRSTHIFINYGNNRHLDRNFPPFAKVVKGMNVVDKLYSGYGPGKISQGDIAEKGNRYLKRNFPKLDYIKTARVLKPEEEVKVK